MTRKRNENPTHLSIILLLSILIMNGHFSSFSSSIVNLETNEANYSSTTILSPLGSKLVNQLSTRNFSYNMALNDSQIILNESIYFNPSTDLQIINCSIFFVAPSPNTHVEISIGELSRLNISNSLLFVASGFGSLSFLGTDVYITNSTIIGLGEYWNTPGLYLNSMIISISHSFFISGFNGLTFSNSQYVEIRNCSFQDIQGIEGYGGRGIFGIDSSGITISNSSFFNTNIGLDFYNCRSISIKNVNFETGVLGVNINPNFHYSEVYDVLVEKCTFYNISVGAQMVGREINILNNSFMNSSFACLFIGGRDITIKLNVYKNSNRGIMTPNSLVSIDPNQPTASSISEAIIMNNTFDHISTEAILISNYEYETVFRIEENNFTNIGIGINFEGNIGGRDSEVRSWVVKNIFNNITEFAIQGSSLDYLAHFQYTSFLQNAFLNSSNGYTSFQSRYYYMDDICWDDGFMGNYWESFINNKAQDEDNNLIGDNLYIVSVDHGQFDQAPLLSLDYIKEKSPIVSNHPTDLVRSKSELKDENATFHWFIRADSNSTVMIFLDEEVIQIGHNISSVEISLLSLSLGLHNFSLIIKLDEQTYRDLVWVRILKDDLNIIMDVLVPIGSGIFTIAIITVIIIGIRKKYS